VRRSEDDYKELAKNALLELVQEELAVGWQEAQARIADRRWRSAPLPINPHHMTNARNELIATGRLRVSSDPARTGTAIELLHPGDDRGIRDRIRTAGRHKRNLLSRVEVWARSTSRYRQGLVGTAAERVVRRSIARVGTAGIRPLVEGDREVATFLGAPIVGGPLDSAAWVDQLDHYGRAEGSVLCPIEVKNVRHWLYSNAAELYQVLFKAARLQEQHPDLDICPVIFCRRCAYDTDMGMSKDLGFRVLEVRRQFILPVAAAPESEVEEVNQALGYDLERTDSPHESVVSVLRGTMRTGAARNAARWKTNGAQLGELYEPLRRTNLRGRARATALRQLHDAASELENARGGW